MQLKLFVPEPHKGIAIHNLFYFKFCPQLLMPNVFGEPPFANYFDTDDLYTNTLSEADAIVLPHNFTEFTSEAQAYSAYWLSEGERLGIPVYVFCFGDFSYELTLDPRAWVFLMSSYQSLLRERDIVVPTTARVFADVSSGVRQKRDRPVVSFCGFAGFKTMRQRMVYALKNLGWESRALVEPLLRAHKIGIYWRTQAMRTLKESPLVETNFIVRRSFSGASRTIELDPRQARQEFIKSIVDADFVLAPKGDGNYSNRFLEALSLGRIPILIDTDVPLPCEREIPYEKIVVRVPMEQVAHIAEYVRRFYDALSEDEWRERQELARTTFREHLEQRQFFTNFFKRP